MLALLLCLCFLSSHLLSAQRTLPSQKALSLSCLSSGRSLCTEFSFGAYTRSGIWEISLGGTLGRQALPPTSVCLQYLHSALQGGYLHRILSNRSRSFGLYLGGGGFAGVESIDPAGNLPPHLGVDLPAHALLCGAYGECEAEFFLSVRTALLLGIHVPAYLSSGLMYLSPSLGAGVRVNLGEIR